MSEELNTAGELGLHLPLSRVPRSPFSSTIDSLYSGSLVPRPFPPPVFDCLQYAKAGGRPERFSHVR